MGMFDSDDGILPTVTMEFRDIVPSFDRKRFELIRSTDSQVPPRG